MRGPVFIFGTGRSGTTYFQRLITMNTSTWVWGEHGGMLGPVLGAVRSFERNAVLSKVIERTENASDSWLINQVANRESSLPWLNRFSPGTMRLETADLLIRLFGKTVPAGWDNWGFKEILYGLSNDVPDILLDVFPRAIALFCFREPKETLISMLRAWNTGLCQDEGRDIGELQRVVQERLGRISTIMRYFLSLRLERGRAITFVSPNEYKLSAQDFLSSIGLTPRSDATPEQVIAINRGPIAIAVRTVGVIEEAWEAAADELTSMYDQALSLSRLDFGSQADDLGAPVMLTAGR